MRGRTIRPFDGDQEEVRRNAMDYEVDSHFSGDSWKYTSPPETSPSGCVSPSESAKILDISIEPVTEGISGEKSSNSPVFENGAGGGGGLYEPA